MDIVTFETARRMKSAGFPQPDYVEDGYFYILSQDTPVNFVHVSGINTQDAAFAPTATDILLELPDYALVFDDSQRPPGFTCYDTLRQNPSEYPKTHENPAEAAALAWLGIHEPQTA
jgi:hypothetical protein